MSFSTPSVPSIPAPQIPQAPAAPPMFGQQQTGQTKPGMKSSQPTYLGGQLTANAGQTGPKTLIGGAKAA